MSAVTAGTFDGVQLTPMERQWWERYSQHSRRQPLSAAEHGAMQCSFRGLLEVTRRDRLKLDTAPRGLRPFEAGGASDIERLRYCLQKAVNKQDQLDIVGSMPRRVPDIDAAFGAGFPVADLDLFDCGTVRRPERGAYANALSYERTKTLAYQELALSRRRLPLVRYKQFFAELEKKTSFASGEELHADEKVVLIKMAAAAANDTAHGGDLLALIEWARRVKTELGDGAWRTLFSLETLRGHRIDDVLAACEASTDLAGDPELEALLARVEARELRLGGFNEALSRHKAIRLQEKYSERGIEEVLAAFGRPTDDVRVPLAEAALARIGTQYRELLQLAEPFKHLSDRALRDTIARLRSEAAGGTGLNGRGLLELLAISREVIRRQFGIVPYNTQMLTVLGVLAGDPARRGRLAQVKTGEGKSTIVALLTATLGVLGHRVDVISSSRPLSIRDQEKYASYLDVFGISSSHICTDEPRPEHFRGQVLYGTNYDFEFAILRDGLLRTRLKEQTLADGRQTTRPSDIAIVDEVDNLFIDQGNNAALISVPGPDPFVAVARVIFDFVQGNTARFLAGATPVGAASAASAPPGVAELRRHLEDSDGGRLRAQVHSLADDSLSKWLSSCISALFVYQEDVHYVIKRKQGCGPGDPDAGEVGVVIVDQQTGQLNEASRWRHRLHQFVEMKHGLDIHPENITAAEISHPVFFGEYSRVYGLTGTIGSDAERKEVLVGYGVDTFDVPPHAPCLRERYAPRFLATQSAFHEAVLEDIVSMQRGGRPCLVLLRTIQESVALSAFLREQHIDHQTLNAIQDEEEGLVVTRAGRAGVVTVATNAAGRGTDIVLSHEAKASGGLHVVLGFYPENDRIEAQGVGRAARQGQPGSSRMILHAADPAVVQLAADGSVVTLEASPALATQALIEVLAVQRARKVAALSQQRLVLARVAKIHHRCLKDLFARLGRWHEALNESVLRRIATRVLSIAPDAQGGQTRVADRATTTLDESPERRRLAREFGRAVTTARTSPTGFKSMEKWLEALRSQLQEEILQTWAAFFDGLSDGSEGALRCSVFDHPEDTEHTDLRFALYGEEIQAQYRALDESLGRLLNSPEQAFAAEVEHFATRLTADGDGH